MMMLSLAALMLGMGGGMQAQAAAAPAKNANPVNVPVTNVMVLLTRRPGVEMAELMKVLPEEARETMLLYLDGRIDHWYSRADGKGVIFFLRCSTVEEAKAIMGGLPLDKAGLVDLEFIPVGPLAPMRMLTKPAEGAPGADGQ